MQFIDTCFQPGAEINNRDNIYSGRPGQGYGLLKNRQYFIQNDLFMEKLTEDLHYGNLDDVYFLFFGL